MGYNGVFEGGGVKGIGLVGALSRVEERGIVFDAVAGTSAGAIVAALYCAGYTAAELKEVLWETNFDALLDPSFSKMWSLWRNFGINEGKRLYEWVYELLRAKQVVHFEDLKKPLTIIASDLTNKEMIRFDKVSNPKMKVAEAVRMSIGIPLVFHAYRWGEKLVVDGGLLSNYPIRVFDDASEKTIGFKLVSTSVDGVPGRPEGFLGFLVSIVGTMLEAHDKEDQRSLAFSSTIHIPTGSISSTKFSLSDEEKSSLFSSGYVAATKFLDEFERGLESEPAAVQSQEASLDRVSKRINEAFAALPTVERPWLLTAAAKRTSLSAEAKANLEEAEKTLAACDLLQVGDPRLRAACLTKIALFWRTENDNERAIERLERAILLDPADPYAREVLGQTLSFVAADSAANSPEKEKLLKRAEVELVASMDLQATPRGESLHALAWTYDEWAKYGKAITLYRRAQQAADGQQHMDYYGYNLACALSKAMDHQDALRELEKIIFRGDFVFWAEQDADFASVRDSPYAGALSELIRKAKAAKGL